MNTPGCRYIHDWRNHVAAAPGQKIDRVRRDSSASSRSPRSGSGSGLESSHRRIRNRAAAIRGRDAVCSRRHNIPRNGASERGWRLRARPPKAGVGTRRPAQTRPTPTGSHGGRRPKVDADEHQKRPDPLTDRRRTRRGPLRSPQASRRQTQRAHGEWGH